MVLIPVSRGYPSARGRLPTRYSPVRRFPLLTSTEASVKSFSLDLHVLGTPPAFILSQDQTLFQWYQIFPSRKSFNLVCLAHFTLLALCDLFRNLFVFFFWNFRKRSSCFLLVRLPSISRKSLDSRSLDFYAMKFSWFASLSGFLRPLLASFFILSHFRLFVKNFFPFFSAPLAAPAASLRQLVYITRSPPPCQSLFLSFFPFYGSHMIMS